MEGLNAGADYYLTKPFNSRELLACINALLRRQGGQVDELVYGNTALDLASGMLVCGDKQVRLSAREFDVMRYLMQNRGQNLSKELILARVWGFDSNAVENHVEVYMGFLLLWSFLKLPCPDSTLPFLGASHAERGTEILCSPLPLIRLSPAGAYFPLKFHSPGWGR